MAHRTVGAGGVAVIVGVDLLFFRSQAWLRLATNIGIVLLFGAFYVRFVAKRCRPNDERRTDATSPLAAGTVREPAYRGWSHTFDASPCWSPGSKLALSVHQIEGRGYAAAATLARRDRAQGRP
jgi:hypothetical protein